MTVPDQLVAMEAGGDHGHLERARCFGGSLPPFLLNILMQLSCAFEKKKVPVEVTVAWGTEMPLQDLRGYTVMDRTVAAGSGDPPAPPTREERKEAAFSMAMGCLQPQRGCRGGARRQRQIEETRMRGTSSQCDMCVDR